MNYSKPLPNPAREAEAQEYAKSYGCTIAEARRDVTDEYNATETDTDAFYERTERYIDAATQRGDYDHDDIN